MSTKIKRKKRCSFCFLEQTCLRFTIVFVLTFYHFVNYVWLLFVNSICGKLWRNNCFSGFLCSADGYILLLSRLWPNQFSSNFWVFVSKVGPSETGQLQVKNIRTSKTKNDEVFFHEYSRTLYDVMQKLWFYQLVVKKRYKRYATVCRLSWSSRLVFRKLLLILSPLEELPEEYFVQKSQLVSSN